MKIKLDNQTEYESRHLRALVLEAAKRWLPEPRQRLGLTVQAVWANVNSPCGRGVIGHNWIKLYLCRREHLNGVEYSGEDKERLAETLWHEFQHNLGRWHRAIHAMRPDPALFEWARDYPLALKSLPAKPGREEVQARRWAHAQAQVKKWQTKVKRAQTALKKWERKVRYYERKAA